MPEFDGLVALVTGGASGIGAATVSLLHERGARAVSLDLDVSAESDADLAVRCDIRDRASTAAAVAEVVEKYGRIDILVNNAAIGAVGDVTANDDDEWLRVLDVNVVGVARMTTSALPHLLASPAASIVNTCSIVNLVGVPQRALYAASKGAVGALTLSMAADLVGQVRVNGVIPGTAETPWVQRLLALADDPEAMAAQLRSRQPMGRLVAPREVAHAIAYLAGPGASSTTGTLLPVDGGMTGVRVPPKT